MRRVRNLKKSQNLIRSVQSHSRDIITSIYSSTDAEQLEFTSNTDLWNICPQNFKNTPQQPSFHTHQPLKDLLPLMKHLSSHPHLDTCSFVLFDYNTIHVVTQHRRITVTKNKKDKAQLRYWLSHIYFCRMRKQLTEALVHQGGYQQHRDVIHASEEKEYMPLAFPGKKEQSAFVRKFTVSSQAMYSKQGQAERQPFCIGYFHSGAEQLFSFTEVLSFIEYPFNLSEVSYLKIIPAEKDGTPKYRASLSKASETLQQRERIDRFKKIIRKEERWRYDKEDMDELKSSMISKKQFEAYSVLALLETVAFLQVNEFIEVKELNVEWIIDEQGNFRLSNCFKYVFEPINTYTTTEGLVTLYQKKIQRQTTSDQAETNKAFRVKKMKSEQKPMTKSLLIPPLNCRSLSNYTQANNSAPSSFRRKTKSTIKQMAMRSPSMKWAV